MPRQRRARADFIGECRLTTILIKAWTRSDSRDNRGRTPQLPGNYRGFNVVCAVCPAPPDGCS